jgi:hypothetical protein
LLRRARAIYDAPDCPLASAARGAGRHLFASGGRWMLLALAYLRGETAAAPPAGLNRLGLVKYGLATGAALPFVGLAVLTGVWPVLVLCVPAFYAAEAQLVFLFPLALDGCQAPYRAAHRLTVRAGGTGAVMGVVLPLAGVMLFGGFAGRGFVRCWCLGCLAVCLWYEDVRREELKP